MGDQTSSKAEVSETPPEVRHAPAISADDLSLPPVPDREVRRIAVAESTYLGPMPPPELLRAYSEISTDLPDRMMKMAEKAQWHACERDFKELEIAREDMQQNWRVVRWGQICGFGLGFFALVGGVVSLWIAPNYAGAWLGTVFGGGGLGTIIWAFRYDRSRERARAESGREAETEAALSRSADAAATTKKEKVE